MPDLLIHQRDHEKMAVSNCSGPTARSWPLDTLKRTLSRRRRRASRRASRIPCGSGSRPTTVCAVLAMTQARRPFPVPMSRTSFPAKNLPARSCRSSTPSAGRTRLAHPTRPTSPTGSAISLVLAGQHRAALARDRGGARRVEDRLLQLLRRLRAGEPPDHLAVRAEQLVEHAVLGARVAARVPPEPVAALGDHERLPHAHRHLPERAPLLLREASRALEEGPRALVRGLPGPDLEVATDPRAGVEGRQRGDRRGRAGRRAP